MKRAIVYIFAIMFFGLCYLAFLRVEQSKLREAEAGRDAAVEQVERLTMEKDEAFKSFNEWKKTTESELYDLFPNETEKVAKLFSSESNKEGEATEAEVESSAEAEASQ